MHDPILMYQEKRQRKQNWAESEYKITWSYKLEVIFELEDISFISYFHKEVKKRSWMVKGLESFTPEEWHEKEGKN